MYLFLKLAYTNIFLYFVIIYRIIINQNKLFLLSSYTILVKFNLFFDLLIKLSSIAMVLVLKLFFKSIYLLIFSMLFEHFFILFDKFAIIIL